MSALRGSSQPWPLCPLLLGVCVGVGGGGGLQGSEAALRGPGSATPSLSHAPLTPQVYRLLFGPSPALDVDSGFPRGQEPWGRLSASSLFRLEVRGLLLGQRLLPASEWVFLPGGCRKGPSGSF